jgi:hypothetical protein
LPELGPVLLAAAAQPTPPIVEAPSRAEPSLAPATNAAASLAAADKAVAGDAPSKAKTSSARRPRGSTQAAPTGREKLAPPASAEECGKLLVLVSTPRCPAGKMASAAAPAGHGKL